MTTTCDTCDRPVPDAGYLCHERGRANCTDTLATALATIQDLAGELEVTVTRRDRIGDGSGGRASAETPLPFNEHASETSWVVRNTLSTWARLVAEERGRALPGDSIAQVAHWLKGHVAWLRCQRFAAEVFDEITYAATALRRACDAPQPTVQLGPCATEECEGQLRAAKGASWTSCRECNQAYDVAERQQFLLARVEDTLETAPVVAAILSTWTGQTLPVNTIYTWANRKRLLKRGTARDGSPTYRLGDAKVLHQAAIARRLRVVASGITAEPRLALWDGIEDRLARPDRADSGSHHLLVRTLQRTEEEAFPRAEGQHRGSGTRVPGGNPDGRDDPL